MSHLHTPRAAVTAALLALGLGFGLTGKAPHAATTQNVATVNYVKGYGIAIWAKNPTYHATVKKLPAGTSWRAFSATPNGKSFLLNLGGDQWMSGDYVDLRGEYATQPLRGTVQLTAGARVALRKTANPNGKLTGKTLAPGSRWKVNGRAVYNGHTWYNLGGQQWIDSSRAVLRHEDSRGTKHYNGKTPTSGLMDAKKYGTIAAPVKAGAIRTAVYLGVNQFRRDHGLWPLAVNTTLTRGAEVRASEEKQIIDKAHNINALGHVRPNGKSYMSEPHLAQYWNQHLAIGENVVVPYLDDTVVELAQDMLTEWENSPTHRQNMLGNYNETGIGVAKLANGQWVGVQEFGLK